MVKVWIRAGEGLDKGWQGWKGKVEKGDYRREKWLDKRWQRSARRLGAGRAGRAGRGGMRA